MNLALPEILMMAALPVLVTLSAFFSGSETALFSLTAHDRLKLARAPGVASHTTTTLLAETRALLITLLLGNMTINVLYFVVSTVLMLRLEERMRRGALVVGALSLATLLGLILLGEILPKMVATRKAMLWSRTASIPLLTVHRLLGPLRAVLSALIITPLARLIAPQQRPSELSPQELEALLELSEERGVIDSHEEHQLQEVLSLSQFKVRDLMIPRVDIAAYDLARPVSELVSLIRETRLSRLPVYSGDLDHIEGIVLARQVLLKQPQNHRELAPLIRQVRYVPELQRGDQLLVQFRKTGTTFAIVVDEYGGTAGLVTLEDVVERMVGQIASAHEPVEAPPVQAQEAGVWRVAADLPIRDWIDRFGADPRLDPELLESVSSVGGLVMAMLGRLPREGDRIVLGNVALEVETMERRRIEWVRVRLLPADPGGPGDPGDPGDRPANENDPATEGSR